ncbi:hypothetical protein [Spiroplasma endosymbiont of Atherix ibis]|uniref:hypothetical protein n=1 Tax=Spiroplasma endosymbiont of Atherix ibis TaxID=3066291 RepID=UPI0030D108CD
MKKLLSTLSILAISVSASSSAMAFTKKVEKRYEYKNIEELVAKFNETYQKANEAQKNNKLGDSLIAGVDLVKISYEIWKIDTNHKLSVSKIDCLGILIHLESTITKEKNFVSIYGYKALNYLIQTIIEFSSN